MAATGNGNWVGGPLFTKIKRGSQSSSGGKNSGGAGRRFSRGYCVLMGALGEAISKAAKARGMSHNQFIAAVNG